MYRYTSRHYICCQVGMILQGCEGGLYASTPSTPPSPSAQLYNESALRKVPHHRQTPAPSTPRPRQTRLDEDLATYRGSVVSNLGVPFR